MRWYKGKREVGKDEEEGLKEKREWGKEGEEEEKGKDTEEKKEKKLYNEKGTLGKRRGGRIGEREVLRRGEGIGRLCGERVIERGEEIKEDLVGV